MFFDFFFFQCTKAFQFMVFCEFSHVVDISPDCVGLQVFLLYVSKTMIVQHNLKGSFSLLI